MKIKYKTIKASEIRLQIAQKKKRKAKARKISERITTEDRLYINNRKSQKEKII